MQRDIEDVVETLKKARDRNKACTLLIGAGCSVKAGIPLAGGFVERIRDEYPRTYNRAKEKTYPHCMAQLSMGERRDLIGRYIDEAQINWAHIGIAQLMKNGYVDRVLTVNFDPLVVRACALVGVFPAVYDFAASQSFNPGFVSGQSVFYLHGQRTGFALLNTPEECERLSQHLGPVFEDSLQGRVCIVAGYSGDNDPVFTHLAGWPRFDNNLYWACYKDNEPPQHAREKLFVDGKDAFYIKGFDADDFFITLAQQLKCFPPDFVGAPFSHLEKLLDTVTPYSIAGQDSNVHDAARKLIQQAIDTFERKEPATESQPSTDSAASLALKASKLLMAGDYDAIIALQPEYDKNPTPDLADTIAWAYTAQGNIPAEQAETKTGDEADQLFSLAAEKYEAALKIKPDKYEALYNWGTTLSRQAKMKTGEEADRLFTLAVEKYESALKFKSDMYEALNNWGEAIAALAMLKADNESDKLFALAGEKFEEAVRIAPTNAITLNDWGNALLSQAKMKTGEEAERLRALAEEKFEAARKLRK